MKKTVSSSEENGVNVQNRYNYQLSTSWYNKEEANDRDA